MTHHLNTVRFAAYLRTVGVILTPAQVRQVCSSLDTTIDHQAVEGLKAQARQLSAKLDSLGHTLKHTKALEALARLYGKRGWTAARAARSGTPPEKKPAPPILDVVMGVQGLNSTQVHVARAYLDAEIKRLLGAYRAEDWDVSRAVDATDADVVRAANPDLLEGVPDEEVSDFVAFILPPSYTEWPPEQLQGDVMQAILDAREYARSTRAP